MSRHGNHAADSGVTDKLVVFQANMDAATRSHYRRAKAEAIDTHLASDRIENFEAALRGEDDGSEGEITDYEMRQRVIGVRAFLRWLKKRAGIRPDQAYAPGPVSVIMMQLFAAGRAMQDPFFSSMSFTEGGLLFSQTKAAASFRSMLLSGFMEEAGAKGTRQPQLKTPGSRESYRAKAMGNKNRAGGKKKERQGSFLRQLKAKKGNPPSRKATARQGRLKLSATSNKKRTGEASVQPKATPTTSGQQISRGSAPTRENGGGVTGASRRSGAYLAQRGDSGCRSGGFPNTPQAGLQRTGT